MVMMLITGAKKERRRSPIRAAALRGGKLNEPSLYIKEGVPTTVKEKRSRQEKKQKRRKIDPKKNGYVE